MYEFGAILKVFSGYLTVKETDVKEGEINMWVENVW